MINSRPGSVIVRSVIDYTPAEHAIGLVDHTKFTLHTSLWRLFWSATGDTRITDPETSSVSCWSVLAHIRICFFMPGIIRTIRLFWVVRSVGRCKWVYLLSCWIKSVWLLGCGLLHLVDVSLNQELIPYFYSCVLLVLPVGTLFKKTPQEIANVCEGYAKFHSHTQKRF